MKKLFDSYFSYIFGLLGFLSFTMPGIKIELGLIISLLFSALYFLFFSLWLKNKHNSIVHQCNVKAQLLRVKENEVELHKEFINKRELFRKHDLPRMSEITTEQSGYLKDKYRGKRFDLIISDITTSQDGLKRIINKEMRDFDEQLFYLPSNKDN